MEGKNNEPTTVSFGKEKTHNVSNISTIVTNSQSSTEKTYQYVIDNANAFAGLCYKIGMGGGRGCSFPVYYELRTTTSGLIEVYATHIVHDDDLLDYAYNRAMENDRSAVEWTYNRMIENYKLTATELRSFQDVSDFMDFLRGGISGYNSCKRSGSDIEITQKLGSVLSHEKNLILAEINKAVLSSYNNAKAKGYGSTALQIYF